ncbi:MAG: AraC family transcriptional regulator [Verrucomicrobiota bacterium]
MGNSSTTPKKDATLKAGTRLKLAYLYSGTALYRPGEVLGPRLLKDFESVLVIEGHPVYETQHGKYRLEPGSIVLGKPGSNETYRWDTSVRTYHAYFHFNLEEIPADWPDLADWPCCRLHPPRILNEMFRYIAETSAMHADWPARSPADADNRIFETFLYIYLNPRQSTEPVLSEFSEPVRRAMQFMRERLDAPEFVPFSLGGLAKVANVSPKHLCRVFQNEFGISPMQTSRLMQFQLAIPLLARSSLSIRAIAERCGFPDQNYFSRNFSQTFGQSPSQLRRKLHDGEPPPPIPLPPSLMPRLYW